MPFSRVKMIMNWVLKLQSKITILITVYFIYYSIWLFNLVNQVSQADKVNKTRVDHYLLFIVMNSYVLAAIWSIRKFYYMKVIIENCMFQRLTAIWSIRKFYCMKVIIENYMFQRLTAIWSIWNSFTVWKLSLKIMCSRDLLEIAIL